MTRQATIRTRHDRPALLARALGPDNTDEMETSVQRRADGADAVVTEIERETTGGLHSTVDDYVVNLEVACSIVERTTNPSDTDSSAAVNGTDAARSDTQDTNDTNYE